HRALQHVRVGRDAQNQALCLSELSLPEGIANTHGAYVLHPSLLDAALQASIGLQAAADKPVLPFALERLEVFAPLPAQATVVIRSPITDHQSLKLDLDIVDDQA